MYHSKNFIQKEIIIEGNSYQMEYDLKNAGEDSIVCFGNIHTDEERVIEFSFVTLNNKIAMYVPLNGSKEFISNIVTTIMNQEIPFEDPFVDLLRNSPLLIL